MNTLPIQKNHFNLSTFEFCDALCLRYLKPLLNVPPKCDGRGDPFTTSHALDCRRGGLVVQRHNEICDLVSDLSSLVWSQVVKEPLFEDDSLHHVGLRADVGIRGACDIWVLDSDAPSYQSTPPARVLRNAEREKKPKYSYVCERQHASFTFLCITVDGIVGPKMSVLLDVFLID